MNHKLIQLAQNMFVILFISLFAVNVAQALTPSGQALLPVTQTQKSTLIVGTSHHFLQARLMPPQAVLPLNYGKPWRQRLV